MNGNSKRERVDSFIRRAVQAGLMEYAWNHPPQAETAHAMAHELAIEIAHNVCGDSYRLRELDDIMHWKKLKEIE